MCSNKLMKEKTKSEDGNQSILCGRFTQIDVAKFLYNLNSYLFIYCIITSALNI